MSASAQASTSGNYKYDGTIGQTATTKRFVCMFTLTFRDGRRVNGYRVVDATTPESAAGQFWMEGLAHTGAITAAVDTLDVRLHQVFEAGPDGDTVDEHAPATIFVENKARVTAIPESDG